MTEDEPAESADYVDFDPEAIEAEILASQQSEDDEAEEEAAEPQETCSDGLLNQDEEDVDCGGVCDACPEEAVPESTGEIAFTIPSYEYEWVDDSFGRIGDVEIMIANDLGKDIEDGKIRLLFYGYSDDSELKDWKLSTDVSLPTIRDGEVYADILKRIDNTALRLTCCRNYKNTDKTLKVRLVSKDNGIDRTVTVDVK